MSGKGEKEDTPKPSKGGGAALLTRAISFKGKLGRQLGGMKSSPRQGDTEKVEPNGNESMNRKVEDVWRALAFYKDVVDKGIFDMLSGSATEVLQAVMTLEHSLKPKFSNQNSSAMSSVFANVYQSLAELVRWSDQQRLYNDETHNPQTVEEIVQAVREAVQALVDLVAEKEKMYKSDSSITPSTIDNNNSIEKSPAYYSNRNSDISNHRNSLPEIKQESPTEQNGRYLMPSDNSGKLSHSRSSDSILRGVEVEAPPPKPPLPIGHDVAPPLPPKRKHPKSSSQDNYASHTIVTSPVGHSGRENSSDLFNHSQSPNSLGTVERGSVSNSSDQVSPASSLDSMIPHDDPPASRTSLNSSGSLHDRSDLDLDLTYQKNLNKGIDIMSDSSFPSLPVQSFTSSTSTSSSSSSHSQYYKRTSENVSVKSRTETHIASSQVMTFSTQRIYSYTTTRSSTCSSLSSSSSASEGEKYDSNAISILVAPKLPEKQRPHPARAQSPYDNLDTDQVDGRDIRFKKEDPSPKLPPKTGRSMQLGSSVTSCGYGTRSTSMVSTSTCSMGGNNVVHLRKQHKYEKIDYVTSDCDDNPPPLPEKKKHVHDYMKLFGQVTEPNATELLRHSVHQIHLLSSMSSYSDHDHDHDFIHSHALRFNDEDDSLLKPPALPPKQKRSNKPATLATPLPLPDLPITDITPDNSLVLSNSNMYRKSMEEKDEPEEVIIKDQSVEIEKCIDFDKKEEEVEEDDEEESLLDLLDVKEYLILKKEGEEGPEIRGGPVDALIAHASKGNKNDFLYQEAFLTTYRTFISPDDLVNKLLKRYNRFVTSPDIEKHKASRNAFSLLVRVVDGLTITDLSIKTLEMVTNFEYGLLRRGELPLAQALRKKIVEKFDAKKRHDDSKEKYSIASLGVTTKNPTLLEFKPQDIAEQMTLLDAELFSAMEIPEVLLWPREQNEEKAPNLNTFTERFNNMSFWARTRILEQEDAKNREKYVMQFIKIMKHLRKINNFHSYLALLSALDSAPVRRLEWQKNITDGLKEPCLLIDSSCSFRAYRQALSDSSPPCIPYIGLILQDLTFVDIGNNDVLQDGNVNFSKRWQQFNILDNMKRFKKGLHSFKKNEKIIAFLNNFDSYWTEEALWHISETIKPRGGKKK